MIRGGTVRRGGDGERGVALVEFALILPALVLLVFGVLDFGKAINYWLDANHLANEGARWVVVKNNTLGEPLATYLRKQADTEELRTGGTDSVASPIQISICYFNGNGNAADGNDDLGDRVRVRATVTYNWLPVLGLDAASSTLTGSADMRIEQANVKDVHPQVGPC
jgi:Flp pilus assembly protein TadG